MLYHYLDETYKNKDGYWHCVIGGLLVPVEKVVEIEIQLTEAINSCNSEIESHFINKEFKLTSFFENNSDEYKYRVFAKLVDVIKTNEIKILCSHALIRTSSANDIVGSFGNYNKMIQYLAFSNMTNYLLPISANTSIQTVVDMGLNKSFKPIYDMYISSYRMIPYIKAIGIDDANITFKNYRNIPIPLFIQSIDSKSIQFSDVLIGLLLASKMNDMSEFKSKLYKLMSPIMSSITCHTIEWNKK